MRIRYISVLLCAAMYISCIFLPGQENAVSNNNPSPGDGVFTGTPPQTKHGKTLVWNDEFTVPGTTDSSKWKYQVGNGNWGWGNGEFQYYTDNTSVADTARVANGMLIIKAYHDGIQWKSARLNSKQSWTYGYIEARLKVTDRKGAWPAFWMMPKTNTYGTWPKSGEIDIMENAPSHPALGPHRVFSTLHAEGHSGGNGKGIGNKTYPNSLFNEWHTFGVKWEANKITAYYDDAEMGSYTSDNTWQNYPYDKDFYIILNLGIGGTLGGGPYTGGPNADVESLKGSDVLFLVDWVRVYQ